MEKEALMKAMEVIPEGLPDELVRMIEDKADLNLRPHLSEGQPGTAEVQPDGPFMDLPNGQKLTLAGLVGEPKPKSISGPKYISCTKASHEESKKRRKMAKASRKKNRGK